MDSRKPPKDDLDNVIPFPGSSAKTKADPQQIESQEFLEVESLEELQSLMEGYKETQNSQVISDFLGLSPNQMHQVLYTPFALDNDLFAFKQPSDEAARKTEIVEYALFLLTHLFESGPLKGTQKGNLPRKLVREFFDKYIRSELMSFQPTGEEDCYDMGRIRHLLSFAGLVKKRQNKFSLTKTGEKIVGKKEYGLLYKKLLMAYVEKWNWGFGDHYPEIGLVQQTCIFNFWMLDKLAQEFVEEKLLGSRYLQAFPALLYQIEGTPYTSAEETAIKMFELRFLDRFCVPFGLLDVKVKKNRRFGFSEYKVSEFFKDCFRFKN